MTGSGKNIARVRLLKKIGIIGLSVSAVAVAVIAIISFLPKSTSAFSVRIDNTQRTQSHFTMSASKDGSSARYLPGKAVTNMYTTSADRLEGQLKALAQSEGGLQGEQNWVELVDSETGSAKESHGLASIFTMFLKNSSDKESQKVLYTLNLDGYNKIDGENPPYEYFRVAAQTQVDGSEEILTKYYGCSRTLDFQTQFNTELPENEQDREPIGRWDVQDAVNPYVESKFSSNGNDGYCVSFNSYLKTKYIIEDEVVIPAGKTLRFTYASYFEGEDFDCKGSAPSGASLLLSLHFGV